MSNVKNQLIKIAYENPELRGELIPVINKIAEFNPNHIAQAFADLKKHKNVLQEALESDIQGQENGHPGYAHVIIAAMGAHSELFDHVSQQKDPKLTELYCRAILDTLGKNGDKEMKDALLKDLKESMKHHKP